METLSALRTLRCRRNDPGISALSFSLRFKFSTIRRVAIRKLVVPRDGSPGDWTWLLVARVRAINHPKNAETLSALRTLRCRRNDPGISALSFSLRFKFSTIRRVAIRKLVVPRDGSPGDWTWLLVARVRAINHPKNAETLSALRTLRCRRNDPGISAFSFSLRFKFSTIRRVTMLKFRVETIESWLSPGDWTPR